MSAFMKMANIYQAVRPRCVLVSNFVNSYLDSDSFLMSINPTLIDQELISQVWEAMPERESHLLRNLKKKGDVIAGVDGGNPEKQRKLGNI